MADKYKAVWVSHSSISLFSNCPRAYYLKHVHKDPKTGNRITQITPPLALGQAVHEVIESLSQLPVEERLSLPLSNRFEEIWEKVRGEKGGFGNSEQEEEYKKRGYAMLKMVEKNPGPIINKAIKIKSDDGMPPNFWLSEEEGIILSGKIDWLEYLESGDSVHIIDFKTGRNEEDEDSLQLPIYLLLAQNLQKRPVSRVSYWYLDKESSPREIDLPDIDKARVKIIEIAKRIKLGRQLEHLQCPKNGCNYCIPLELIIKGKAKKVAQSDWQDIYILD